MEYCKKEIKKVLKLLPSTDRTTDIKKNILDMAEDKYNDLISEGMEVSKVREIVVKSFSSLDELKEVLGIEELQLEYEQFTKVKERRMKLIIAGAYLLPLFFIIVAALISELSETLATILLLIGFICIPLCIGYGIYLSNQDNKYKKLLMTQEKKEENLIANLIGSIVIFFMLFLSGIGLHKWIVISMIPLGSIAYYCIMLYRKRKMIP